MRVGDLVEALGWKVLAGEEGLEREVTGGYVCDLLSWVMSHAGAGNVWITVLTNLNVVAVALLAEVACVVVPEGIHVEEATVDRARQQGVVLLSAPQTGYEICWGIREIMQR